MAQTIIDNDDIDTLYKISQQTMENPAAAQAREIELLTYAALRMPSNLTVRYNATRFLYHMREFVMCGDARFSGSFIDGKFGMAKGALKALRAVSDHDPTLVDQTALARATQRKEEILAIEPFYLTKLLHRKLPRMPISSFMVVIGQPSGYDLTIAGLRMDSGQLNNVVERSARLRNDPASGQRDDFNTLAGAVGQKPGPWTRFCDASRVGLGIQKFRNGTNDAGYNRSPIRHRLYVAEEAKRAIDEILKLPAEAIGKVDRQILETAVRRIEQRETTRSARIATRLHKKASARLASLGITY